MNEIYEIIIFILLNFLVSALSDLGLNFLSSKSYSTKLIQSLRTYFDEHSTIISAIYAGLTVIITLIITILFSKLIMKFWIPNNYFELLQFLILAFVIGFIADFLIYKFQLFGTSLNEYYNLTTPGIWGAIAFLFSILISYVFWQFLLKPISM